MYRIQGYLVLRIIDFYVLLRVTIVGQVEVRNPQVSTQRFEGMSNALLSRPNINLFIG